MSFFSKKSKDEPAQRPASTGIQWPDETAPAAQAAPQPPAPQPAPHAPSRTAPPQATATQPAASGPAAPQAATARAAPRPAPIKAPQISAAETQALAERTRKTLVTLGEIVSVLMKSPEYRNATLADVQLMIGPAMSTGQFMVLSAQDPVTGISAPTAVAMWANVNEAVDRRISEGSGAALKPEDWTGGDTAWLIVLAGERRILPALLDRLRQTSLKGRVLKMRARGDDGQMVVRTLPPIAAAPEPRIH